MDTSLSPEAEKLAKQEKIEIKQHRIIYSLIDDLKNLINKFEVKDKV